jgi:mannose-6-phosphate isomerase-like protein (cupin superfamily)
MEKIRRVVSGIDGDGKSVFVSDEEVKAIAPPILGGARLIDLFGEDEIPTVPNDGSHDESRRYFPAGPGSYRYTLFSYPPQGEMTIPDDLEAAIVASAKLAPGLEDAVSEPDGWHYTPTVDLEYVIEGEFTLTVDDGASKVLKAGDVMVQCGAKHSWVNNGPGQATMLLVFIGAEFDESRFGKYKIGS